MKRQWIPDVSDTYKIIGKPEMTCGIRRKYTLLITDNAGNKADNVAYTWNVLADFEEEQIVNGNQITLCVDDEKMGIHLYYRLLQIIMLWMK